MIEVETIQRDGETLYEVHGLLYGHVYVLTEREARELAEALQRAMEQEKSK